jgi:galactose mutarotase-like enzyme
MSSYTISNEEVLVTVDEHASEIHHFKDLKTGIEYMWKGDPVYWSGRNPTLFPMVGSTWDKQLHIKGRTYQTGNHGFARHSDFTCIEHNNQKIVMRLADSEETLKQYPYHFTMDISYSLAGRTLTIHYAIRNDNNETMPFHFGLHPAFNVPMDPAGSSADYQLVFDEKQNFTWKNTEMKDENVLKLDPDALADTIIIHHPAGTNVSLTDGTHGVTVDYSQFEWLAFWSPHAPFVCIEPWLSHTDFERVDVPYDRREGTRFIEPGKVFEIAYSITVR